MSTNNEQIEFIINFVKKYRKQKNITPTVGYKIEPSAESRGEGYALLFGQLIHTPDGMNGWLELNDSKVRELVIAEIKKYEQTG